MVSVAVTTPAEPVTGGFSRGSGYGRDSNEGGELGLICKAVRIVSDGNQELAGYFCSDTWKVTEHRRVRIEDLLERGVGGSYFCSQ
jgi:hypothetical protein